MEALRRELAESGTAGLAPAIEACRPPSVRCNRSCCWAWSGMAPVLPLFDSQMASHLPGRIEGPFERALSRRGYRDGAGAVAAAQPALREAGPAQGRAKYAGDVRSALTPVQAWPAEEVSANAFVAAGWRCVEIDAEDPQENCASFREHPATSEQFNTPFPTWPPTKPIAPGCGTTRSAAKITRSPGRDVSSTAKIAFSCAWFPTRTRPWCGRDSYGNIRKQFGRKRRE